MRDVARLLGLAVVMLGAGIVPAQAKVPIPCTGESIVKVLDIPATRGLELPVNKGMPEPVLNLGYKFKYCFGGEWVGHVGGESRYLPLDDNGLKALLALAGLTAPPPTPTIFSHPSAHMALWTWLIVLGCVGVGCYVQKKAPEPATDATESSAMDSVQASATPVVAQTPVPVSPRMPASAPRRTPAAAVLPVGARQAFGQR